MKLLILVLALVGFALSLSFHGNPLPQVQEAQFQAFIQKYNKSYVTKEEYNLRFENFKQSIKRINSKNKLSKGVVYAINKFSDMTPQEFKEKMLMKPIESKKPGSLLQPKPNLELPKTFDWRAKGAVTPVKNQEQCGSCWAFSTVENIESVWILSGHGSNTSVDLSPQQVVDCDQTDLGCNGGDPPTAYEYVISAGGLESESEYPYVAQDQNCRFQKSEVVAKISNWKYATQSNDENEIQQNLVSWAPLSICVDAANWQDYSSGVMGPWECAWIVQLDHCVQLIGYNQEASTPYWIVRNSWGTDWGINGYIYLEMFHNTCGMAEEATTSVA